ncbi:YbaB/EbfC family nucleoid-associated protein [Actinomadura rugatobispora]|uniref:YbaB/EbfC family nucleoid-associated protein n=1 Tax=Actinomadura rugatobispora TaxID=1994 RepID=A0ABW0ZU81_9ACTN|nr:hypothetical protein GCM10010200_111240 [Actinomadura rugatobispora]
MDDFKKVLGFDPGKLAEDSETFFARLRDMHEIGLAVTARTESADRRVAVEYSSAEGVRVLEIDPRAMRVGAGELAATILELIRRARAEVEAEGQERLTEALGDENSLVSDRYSFGRELRNATTAVTENLEAAKATLAELQALLRR